ncbi:MAG TPA: hypothetical protein VKX16_01250 [Chloroflexota bacterium]|nr:hypothetical protein [Chloroflexota bacterium]
MASARSVQVKAKAILRQLGHSDGEPHREYKDWHIEIRGGTAFVTVWSSARMVFLSMADVPVFYVPGPWEQYLERLFQKTSR